jgi:hypothetical protein
MYPKIIYHSFKELKCSGVISLNIKGIFFQFDKDLLSAKADFGAHFLLGLQREV